jgi:hypothetical protein
MAQPAQQTPDIKPGSPAERKGLALSALIIALSALFCAFINGWRLFSSICAVVALMVAVFCISKARKPGGRAKLALWALAIGILSLLVTGYFLLTRVPDTPAQPTDVGVHPGPADRGDAIDKLQEVTDTSSHE